MEMITERSGRSGLGAVAPPSSPPPETTEESRHPLIEQLVPGDVMGLVARYFVNSKSDVKRIAPIAPYMLSMVLHNAFQTWDKVFARRQLPPGIPPLPKFEGTRPEHLIQEQQQVTSSAGCTGKESEDCPQSMETSPAHPEESIVFVPQRLSFDQGFRGPGSSWGRRDDVCSFHRDGTLSYVNDQSVCGGSSRCHHSNRCYNSGVFYVLSVPDSVRDFVRNNAKDADMTPDTSILHDLVPFALMEPFLTTREDHERVFKSLFRSYVLYHDITTHPSIQREKPLSHVVLMIYARAPRGYRDDNGANRTGVVPLQERTVAQQAEYFAERMIVAKRGVGFCPFAFSLLPYDSATQRVLPGSGFGSGQAVEYAFDMDSYPTQTFVSDCSDEWTCYRCKGGKGVLNGNDVPRDRCPTCVAEKLTVHGGGKNVPQSQK